MSDYTRLAQVEAEARWGASAKLRLHREPGRCIAVIEQLGDDRQYHALAIASGADHGAACVTLMAHIWGDVTVTTEQAREILGYRTVGSVAHMLRDGKISPARRGGKGGVEHRYSPDDVWRLSPAYRATLAEAGRTADG